MVGDLGLKGFFYLNKKQLTLCEQVDMGLYSRLKLKRQVLHEKTTHCFGLLFSFYLSHSLYLSPPVFLSSNHFHHFFSGWTSDFESFLSTTHSSYFQDSCHMNAVNDGFCNGQIFHGKVYSYAGFRDSDPRNRSCQLEKQVSAPINVD